MNNFSVSLFHQKVSKTIQLLSLIVSKVELNVEHSRYLSNEHSYDEMAFGYSLYELRITHNICYMKFLVHIPYILALTRFI